ncbi:hypothetical protein QR680_011084 [Steinernema hermaphroditum]|uniref:7TM GPCR serpentine receptor class x (Srx) domain-containing protein n=1 Tax=Steinernema hermaphroditum TaxID=289476 RepID=A0AA39ISJ7_9BILA|nr:hypothetical protein QR680_011084 [Steinernema hermaphroditum]
MNSSKFVFGFEFQGRGEVTERDIIVGSIMLALSLTAVILGSTNLVIIYRSTIFHSAFGCAFLACMIHQAVSTNRFIAVFLPHRYKFIFTKRRCVMIVLSLSIPVVAFDIAYIG